MTRHDYDSGIELKYCIFLIKSCINQNLVLQLLLFLDSPFFLFIQNCRIDLDSEGICYHSLTYHYREVMQRSHADFCLVGS